MSRLPLAAALLFLALICSTTPGHTADEMVWSFSEGNDPSNRGRTTARLSYGLPETDLAQVSGVCEARSSTSVNTLSLTLGADIGRLQNGTSVGLRFTGGGFNHSVPATIIGANAEVGITGVQLELSHADPLWKSLGEKASLDYLVPGYSAANLDLRQGHQQIAKFIAACRSYADALMPTRVAQADTQPATQSDGGGSSVSERKRSRLQKSLAPSKLGRHP